MKPYQFFRPLLFRLNPENVHKLSIYLMYMAGEIRPINGWIGRIFAVPFLPVQEFGLNFPNPIGLAAGYDKDGLGWRGLACLGFGHIEVGTVTPEPQAGNPKPRLFRLPEEEGLINRMGFPGRGAEFVLRQISRPRPRNLILGVNIGKNKDTPLETSADDYLKLMNIFAPLVDYLAINVSSPNTIGLRQLQERQALDRLLNQIDAAREQLIQGGLGRVPLLVKLAPDLDDEQLDDALDVIQLNHMDGVIATNTTISREGVNSKLAIETGGLSGKPLFKQSLALVDKIYKRTGGRLPIVGAGGIFDANSVHQMMDAGAKLVQIYTGLVYQGPGIVKSILLHLSKYS
jgi:dihydroorotate dehydrogenase